MIILLNGCSSAGKSSIAKAIQHLSPLPWLHLALDTFIDMMPSRYTCFGTQAVEGFHFIANHDDNGPLVRVETGPYGRSVSRSIPQVAHTLAKLGHNMIIDEVFFDDEEVQAYIDALFGYPVYFTGVVCDLEVLQEREILRGDRSQGLARDQITRLHKLHVPYDIMVDSTHNSSFVCARKILSFVEIHKEPLSFAKL